MKVTTSIFLGLAFAFPGRCGCTNADARRHARRYNKQNGRQQQQGPPRTGIRKASWKGSGTCGYRTGSRHKPAGRMR